MPRDLSKAAPKNMKVLFENERVRVVELNWKKGLKLPMHSHPEYFTYGITSLKYKSTSNDGKVAKRGLKKGEVKWYAAESHAVESVGDTGRAIVVELK
jgi:quercetin dioxygenase-like cupin family protein